MNSLKKLIEENYNEFNSLGCSEIIHCNTDEFDDSEIDYLKENYRFDYNGICIYYVKEDNEVWIENMMS